MWFIKFWSVLIHYFRSHLHILFLLIFTKILIELEFSYLSSIIFANIINNTSTLLDISKYDLDIETKLVKLSNILLPKGSRPLISNLFLFGFLYFILKFYLSKIQSQILFTECITYVFHNARILLFFSFLIFYNNNYLFC